MNALVISTIPHYFAIIPTIVYNHKYSIEYSLIILVSSSLSILWHLTSQQHTILKFLDYFLACLWFLSDISISNNSITVILLNGIILLLNLIIQNNLEYQTWHSIWHICSSLKCLYISYFIMSQTFVRRKSVITLLPLRSENLDMLKIPLRRMRV
jgi:hypothetical protein